MPDASKRNERSFRWAGIGACAGYALLLLACQLTVWGGLRLTKRTGFELLPLLAWWTVPLLVSLAVALLVCGALAAWLPRRAVTAPAPGKRVASWAVPSASGALMLAGYGIVVAAPPASALLVGAGAVVLGAGMGALFAAWAALFSRFTSGDAETLVLLSLIACAVLSLVLGLFPLGVLEVAYVIAVCASAALLVVSVRVCARANGLGERASDLAGEGTDGRDRSHAAGALVREAFARMRNPLFCAAAIAFAVAITRMMTLGLRPDVVGASSAACMVVGAAASLAVLRCRWGRRAARLSIPVLFRILFPLVATLLLALSVGGEQFGQASGAAVFAVWGLMSALMIPACNDVAKSTGLRAAAVYGLFAGIVYAVFAAATSVGLRLFTEGGGFGATTTLVATLLVLYVLAMAFALVQRRASGEAAAARPDNGEAADADEGTGADAAGSRVFRDQAADVPATATDAADPIERRCLVLARERGLSPRETDVLVAFAHGRNVSYLAERLCLSPNTIRSHSKTLYTKLGVHSKQELLNLVEEAEPDRA